MDQAFSRMRPERTAWIVLWSAFAVFCLLVIAVPLSVRAILLYSTQSRNATLQALEGTVVIDNPVTGQQQVVTKGQTADLVEGSLITLDDKASAEISFFEGSSVHIRPDSQLAIERLQAPRFGAGVKPNTVRLRMVKGQAKVVTSEASGHTGLDFVLALKHLNAELEARSDGVYGAEVQTSGATVFAHRGSAIVSANGASVQLIAPERTTIELGQVPTAPVADAREFLINGDFAQCLSEAWTVYNDQGMDGGDVPGVWSCDEESHTVRFYRSNSQRNHCETIIEQEINRDLPDPVSSLVVRANIKIVNQSLSGGGYLASEYPLMIRVKYRDEYGSENEWIQGFYLDNAEGNPTTFGRQIPRDTWYYFESENLLDTLRPTPFRILSIRVYASGWDYESMIRYVSLAVQ